MTTAKEVTSQIWEMANRVRGNMDASEYRNYILGFMFYRYLSERQEKYLFDNKVFDENPDNISGINEEYAKEAESAYQQIVDLIDRFQKIDAAIVDSNARTEITTSYGTFTVAGAIALRSRLRGVGAYGGDADFEGRLQKKLAN